MRTANWLVMGLVAVTTACSDPVMEQRVADLETKIGELEKQIAEGGARGAAAPAAPSAEQEEQAAVLLREANDLATAMNYEGAKEKLAELTQKYPTTRAARSSRRMASELEIVGLPAGSLEIEKWYQGETSMDEGEATLVVFWEVWCPHCRREVPQIEATWDKYKDDGLNVVAVTKITKSATEEGVISFIEENELSYPIAKETGAMSERFGVRGIPAAAVVKDGKIVWRGHPARLNDAMYRSWLDLPAEG